MLALLAGRGRLPLQVVSACQHRNIPFLVVAFEGQTDPQFVQQHRHVWVRMGAIGNILDILKHQGVDKIVMAGSLKRPSFTELGLDKTGLSWLAKIGIKAFGDDGLLSGVIKMLEGEGFQVLSAPDLIDDLLCPQGILTTQTLNDQDWQDVTRGVGVLKTLGSMDVGQAVVVSDGLVLGIEALEGTAALIERCGTLNRSHGHGVLIKMAKSGQSLKVDLPTVGLETVRQIKEAGFRGMALQAKVTQILDRERVIMEANAAGIFIVGIEG